MFVLGISASSTFGLNNRTFKRVPGKRQHSEKLFSIRASDPPITLENSNDSGLGFENNNSILGPQQSNFVRLVFT